MLNDCGITWQQVGGGGEGGWLECGLLHQLPGLRALVLNDCGIAWQQVRGGRGSGLWDREDLHLRN